MFSSFQRILLSIFYTGSINQAVSAYISNRSSNLALEIYQGEKLVQFVNSNTSKNIKLSNKFTLLYFKKARLVKGEKLLKFLFKSVENKNSQSLIGLI